MRISFSALPHPRPHPPVQLWLHLPWSFPKCLPDKKAPRAPLAPALAARALPVASNLQPCQSPALAQTCMPFSLAEMLRIWLWAPPAPPPKIICNSDSAHLINNRSPSPPPARREWGFPHPHHPPRSPANPSVRGERIHFNKPGKEKNEFARQFCSLGTEKGEHVAGQGGEI